MSLRPAYATTFNSCQCLTLDRIVIDLRTSFCPWSTIHQSLSGSTERRCEIVAFRGQHRLHHNKCCSSSPIVTKHIPR
ncbi:hypothetical protein FN846DRAFT_544202 [Sphaerosporella brunnea]|uniref:Uncharacterized protein n=1 Tax=Sphaerosporella brunnea TaxID=1250544 RepID=A0A5J5F3E7_9PEZI|nr:hypothetical protein FN846DRAFT_544202 [Sphaerosporella brunnea]